MTGDTLPVALESKQTAPTVIVQATCKDPVTKALFVHQDLIQAMEPWAEEAHIAPMNVKESFGDVESWVTYVKGFGLTGECAPFLTWNSSGLEAVLDYASRTNASGEGPEPGRCEWEASCPFVRSRQWQAWTNMAGRALTQRQAIEYLEDLAADIVDPTAADLANLLRMLRASVKASADVELRPDGTSKVQFEQDKVVKGGPGSVDLPAFFTIAIPALKGHVNEDGKPVVYRLQVRVRLTVEDNAHLTFRFSIPDADQVLEDAYADRVQAAKVLLGDGYQLLRAAD